MASYMENMQNYFKNNGKTREFAAHSSKVHSVDWNSDGRKLASGSYDKTVNVFHLDRDRLVCCCFKLLRFLACCENCFMFVLRLDYKVTELDFDFY